MLFFLGQISCASALEGTYDYATWGCSYEYYVEASDTWLAGTQLEVTVRLTLVQKGTEDRQIEYVTNPLAASIEFLRLFVKGGKNYTWWTPDFQIDESPVVWGRVEYDESVNLTENGSYWEKKFHLTMEDQGADMLGRGETINATLYVHFSLEEYDANHTLLNVPPVGGPTVQITMSRPLLSTVEAVTLAGVCVGGIALAVYFKSRRPSLVRLFSRLSAEHPFLTRVISSITIGFMWLLFITAMLYYTLTYPQHFSFAVYVVFFLAVVGLVILTVGLLEFILEGWGMLKTALGFIISILFVYICYLAMEYWLL